MAKPTTKPNQPAQRSCTIHGAYTGDECPGCAAVEEESETDQLLERVLGPSPAGVAVCDRRGPNGWPVCGHTRAEHCKGGQVHVYYKVKQNQRALPHELTTCEAPHCLQPLCTCIAFVPAPAGEGVPNV